jgi:hypothetical protein
MEKEMAVLRRNGFPDRRAFASPSSRGTRTSPLHMARARSGKMLDPARGISIIVAP